MEERMPNAHQLEHMEPNQRFEFSETNPTMADIEKSIPLYINNLTFNQDYLRVNHTTYRLTLIRKPTGGQPLLAAYLRDNANGGIKYDLDEFGMRDHTAEVIMMPGDIYFESPGQMAVEEDSDEKMEKEEKLLEGLRVAYQTTLSADLKATIDGIEAKVLPWKCRLENKEPPFETAVLVTRREGDGESKWVEDRFKKLYEAKKTLLYKFFGGRPTVIVEKLDVSKAGGVLRLPAGLKLRVGYLTVGANVASILNSLEPILDHQSFPMKKLTVMIGAELLDPVNYEHEILRNAKILQLVNSNYPIDSVDWLPVILEIVNPRLEVNGILLSATQLLCLIDKWIEDGRPIGRSAIIGVYGREVVSDLFDVLRDRQGVVTKVLEPRPFPEMFMIPISAASALRVECDYTMASSGTSRLCLHLMVVHDN
uniref:Smr domain-containing protein n=1 Tax=Caenorhabditis tropicalis TaxID=1561998 RepID=A0A1I7UGH4_9PELO